MVVVYTLELADGCFYVGRVKDRATLESRVEQHTSGQGAEWTKLHPVIGVYKTIEDAKGTDEDAQVIALVAEFGVDKVRGGTFCTTTLTEAEAKLLQKMADSSKGTCYLCHEVGHCANECSLSIEKAMKRGGDWVCPDCGDHVFAKNDECRKCGKWKPKDKTINTTPGHKPGDWTCPKCGDHVFSKNKACRKCGTLKHPRDEEEKEKPPMKKARSVESANDDEKIKSGDWLCAGCDFHNFASRKTCFKCKKVKPLKDATPIASCSICMDKPVTVAAQPCGHICFCEVCAQNVDGNCPICRGPMTAKQTMFQ